MEITSTDKDVILNILVVVFHQEVCIGAILSMSSLSELEKQPKVEQGLWLMVFGPEAAVLKLKLELIVYLLTGSIAVIFAILKQIHIIYSKLITYSFY